MQQQGTSQAARGIIDLMALALANDVSSIQLTSIDQIDSTLFSRIDCSGWQVDGESTQTRLQAAAANYRRLLSEIFGKDLTFTVQQSSNIVVAKVAGAVAYPGSMRTQREALDCHYRLKLHFACRLGFAVIQSSAGVTLSEATADSVSFIVPPFLTSFSSLTYSQLRLAMRALIVESSGLFQDHMTWLGPSGMLELHSSELLRGVENHLRMMSDVSVQELQQRISMEVKARQHGCRLFDSLLLSQLVNSIRTR